VGKNCAVSLYRVNLEYLDEVLVHWNNHFPQGDCLLSVRWLPFYAIVSLLA
jgi:hypothetical protein